MDRELARELLAARADASAKEAALAEEMLREAAEAEKAERSARRYEPAPRRTRAQSSLGEELARTVVKQLGTRQGQKLVRGILGGLFRAR